MPSRNGTKKETPSGSVAEQLYHRFEGLARGHGRAHIKPDSKPTPGQKFEPRHETVHDPTTVNHWERHLAGQYSLGIVPIRDDATCCFGAIDVDVYNLDLKKLGEDVAKAGLPLVMCRTKSGGAHLYCFVTSPVPAAVMRPKLMEWAIVLGYAGVEVYPKQTKLAGANDYGNWLNMPYYEGNSTSRYAVAEGKPLKVEQFLELADLMAVTPVGLKDFQPEAVTEFQEWLENGPPCLQSLAKTGFGEGMRNNGLFNIGVYLRKRYGDDNWEEKLDQYNNKFLHPPLGHKEVAAIVKSLSRKAYEFKCHDQPIVSVCNRQICLTRRFGVGQGEDDPGVVFGRMVKLQTEPPMWIWDVDGARMELTTQELKDQARFHTRAMEVLNKWPRPVKPKTWADLVRKRLENVEIQDVPPDATQEGQMWAHLEWYCTGRTIGKKKEDLLRFQPWTNPEDGRTYFSATHFRQYLAQQRMVVNEKQLWSWLRKRGAEHAFWKIKGKGINLWHVTAFAAQTEDFDPVDVDQEL